MSKKRPDKFLTTDNMGIVHQGGKTYKAISYHGGKVKYQEIDVKEYDARITKLVGIITAAPNVDLVGILRAVLYDIPLKWLEEVEETLEAEAARAKKEERVPDIKTAKQECGTRINLDVAGRFCAILKL